MSQAQIAFEMRKIRIPLTRIIPIRQIKDPQTQVERYNAILSSIKVHGLVEPLMVYPQENPPNTYLLLDGHFRLRALKELGQTEADCLVAHDDESFTFNARVSRLAPVQEHWMIKKAILNGVSADRIAAALGKSMKAVQACMSLLDGVTEQASELLKDKAMSHYVLRLLKRVTPVRQIEIAEYLINSNNFTIGFVEALIMGTPKDQMVAPEKKKKRRGLSREEIARLEQEMESMGRDFKAVEKSYGESVLNLTLLRGYAKKLLENTRVTRFLKTNHPDIFGEFETIAAVETL